MGGQVRMQVEGGEALIRALRRMGVDVGQVLAAAVQAGGEVIADAANAHAPAPEIEAETTKTTKTRAEAEVGPPQDRWYWKFVESGATAHEITGNPLIFQGDQAMIRTGRVAHTGMAARPFLRPAFDGAQGRAVEAVRERLDQAIEP